MASRTRKPAETRRREIAEAVLRVIGQRGLTSLTAAALAEEVGLTPGALFRHFATLDEILEAAVALGVAQIEETFPPPDLPPIERLRGLALRRVELLGQNPGLAWLLLSEQVYLTVPSKAVQGLHRLVERSKGYLLDALHAGAADGSLRGDLEPEVMLVLFTGTVHALIGASGVHRTVPPGLKPPGPERVLESLLALLSPPPSSQEKP